jgi:hypothetical protein
MHLHEHEKISQVKLKTIWENTIGKEKIKGERENFALFEIVRVKTQFNRNDLKL